MRSPNSTGGSIQLRTLPQEMSRNCLPCLQQSFKSFQGWRLHPSMSNLTILSMKKYFLISNINLPWPRHESEGCHSPGEGAASSCGQIQIPNPSLSLQIPAAPRSECGVRTGPQGQGDGAVGTQDVPDTAPCTASPPDTFLAPKAGRRMEIRSFAGAGWSFSGELNTGRV